MAGGTQTEMTDSLPDRLANALREDILTGRLRPGSRLIQEDLAREFGVSRTPIREAIRHLQALGLVVTRPKRGIVVRPIDRREALEAYAVRAELEGMAARLAAREMTEEDLRMLQEHDAAGTRALEAVEELHMDGDWSALFEQWHNANQEFHALIMAASGNHRLAQVIDYTQRIFPRNLGWLTLTLSDRFRAEDIGEHAEIITALKDRRARAADQAMQRHVLQAGERFDRWLQVQRGRDRARYEVWR